MYSDVVAGVDRETTGLRNTGHLIDSSESNEVKRSEMTRSTGARSFNTHSCIKEVCVFVQTS